MEKDPLTYTVIGCAMKVHNTLGPGFQEVIYQRCLAIELSRAGLSFVRELDHIVYYEDIDVGTRRADFVDENVLIVELKAKYDLEAAFLIQAKNYTKIYDFPRGLLFNFGSTSLQYKLLFNPKYNDPDYVKQKKEKMKIPIVGFCEPMRSDVKDFRCPYCGK
ncbi:MAG TPA: GxxExxY protein [Saprospiraceae bacterium]|nr:GxxExxY protein [Saprospiraceae bacterium]